MSQPRSETYVTARARIGLRLGSPRYDPRCLGVSAIRNSWLAAFGLRPVAIDGGRVALMSREMVRPERRSSDAGRWRASHRTGYRYAIVAPPSTLIA